MNHVNKKRGLSINLQIRFRETLQPKAKTSLKSKTLIKHLKTTPYYPKNSCRQKSTLLKKPLKKYQGQQTTKHPNQNQKQNNSNNKHKSLQKSQQIIKTNSNIKLKIKKNITKDQTNKSKKQLQNRTLNMRLNQLALPKKKKVISPQNLLELQCSPASQEETKIQNPISSSFKFLMKTKTNLPDQQQFPQFVQQDVQILQSVPEKKIVSSIQRRKTLGAYNFEEK